MRRLSFSKVGTRKAKVEMAEVQQRKSGRVGFEACDFTGPVRSLGDLMGTGRARGRQVSLEMTEIWSRNFLFGGFGVLRVTKSFPVIFGQLFCC